MQRELPEPNASPISRLGSKIQILNTSKAGGTTVVERSMLGFVNYLKHQSRQHTLQSKLLVDVLVVSAFKLDFEGCRSLGVTSAIRSALGKFVDWLVNAEIVTEEKTVGQLDLIFGENEGPQCLIREQIRRFFTVDEALEKYVGDNIDPNEITGAKIQAESWAKTVFNTYKQKIIQSLSQHQIFNNDRVDSPVKHDEIYSELKKFVVGYGEDVSCGVSAALFALNKDISVINLPFLVDGNGRPRSENEIYRELIDNLLQRDLACESRVELMRAFTAMSLADALDDNSCGQ